MIFRSQFVLLIIFGSVGVSANCKNPLPSESTKRYRVYCPEGSAAYNRTATSENFNTGIVCIDGVYATFTFNASAAVATCQYARGSGAFLAAPESAQEASEFYNRMAAYFEQKNFPLDKVTVVIDGKRKEECKTAESFNVAPCTATGTFQMTNPTANTDYIFSRWGPNQPSNSVVDGVVKSCLGINANLQIRDIFCDQEESPNEYQIYGFYCGTNPIREEY